MRHSKKGRKFGLKKNKREALMRSLALSLINEEKIQTTLPKAKELRPFVEKLITKAKEDSIANKRVVRAKLGVASRKLFTEIGPMFKDRNGGYTRITKLGFREKDASPMAQIELVQSTSKKV